MTGSRLSVVEIRTLTFSHMEVRLPHATYCLGERLFRGAVSGSRGTPGSVQHLASLFLYDTFMAVLRIRPFKTNALKWHNASVGPQFYHRRPCPTTDGNMDGRPQRQVNRAYGLILYWDPVPGGYRLS